MPRSFDVFDRDDSAASIILIVARAEAQSRFGACGSASETSIEKKSIVRTCGLNEQAILLRSRPGFGVKAV
jgi:hypothetical protein